MNLPALFFLPFRKVKSSLSTSFMSVTLTPSFPGSPFGPRAGEGIFRATDSGVGLVPSFGTRMSFAARTAMSCGSGLTPSLGRSIFASTTSATSRIVCGTASRPGFEGGISFAASAAISFRPGLTPSLAAGIRSNTSLMMASGSESTPSLPCRTMSRTFSIRSTSPFTEAMSLRNAANVSANLFNISGLFFFKVVVEHRFQLVHII